MAEGNKFQGEFDFAKRKLLVARCKEVCVIFFIFIFSRETHEWHDFAELPSILSSSSSRGTFKFKAFAGREVEQPVAYRGRWEFRQSLKNNEAKKQRCRELGSIQRP